MIDTDHANDLLTMLRQAIADLSNYGYSCHGIDNGMRTYDILTTNLSVIYRLIDYANVPPSFTYFLHRTPHRIMLDGTEFGSIDQLSIHT